MIITEHNYNDFLRKFREEDKYLSEKLIKLFDMLNIENVSIASVGNSISSGYSKCDEMLPFLMRSEVSNSKSFNIYNYARVRRNEERKIIGWYKSNISHQEINSLLIDDIMAKLGKYANFSQEDLQKYEEMRDKSDLGFGDFVKLSDNIIIYNGLTGSFTDRIRKGNVSDKLKLFSSFKEDFADLKSLLYQFYLDNPNLQIYVCGIPDFLGLGISSSFDRYLKLAISEIPNARYVPGVTKNIFSRFSGQKEFDIHYSVPEYLCLLNSVFEEILMSYIPLKIKNRVLNELSIYSDNNELISTTSKGKSDDVRKIILEVLEEYDEIIRKNNIDVKAILNEVCNFYDQNYLLFYPCTNRLETKKIIKCIMHQ